MSNQKQSKKFDPSSLPYIMASAQALQFAHAGYILMGWVGVVIGLVIGGGVSFSVAYAASQIGSITGQKREKWANPTMLIMLCISPIALIAPSYVSFGVLDFLPVWRWITAGIWASAPDGAIFLASLVTGKGMVAKDEKPTETVAKPRTKRTKPELNDAKLEEWFKQHPDATQAAAAKYFQVSHTAISKRLKRMYSIVE
jgi:hypothetical protein